MSSAQNATYSLILLFLVDVAWYFLYLYFKTAETLKTSNHGEKIN
jgi:hypothetical protein